MPVGTGNISLTEVLAEVTGESSQSLVGAIGAANSAGYDPTYYTAPATSLSEFKGYNDNPANVTISPTNLSFSSAAQNSNISVTVVGGASWTASDNQTWIFLTGTTSGTTSATTTVNVNTNTGGSTRFGTVTFTWSGTNRTCTITQQP